MMPIPIDSQSHKFIFIAGLHRSGTSLLFKILRDHPDINGFSNTGVPEDEGSHLQNVYTQPRHLGRAGFFALHPQAYHNENSSLVTDSNRQKLWDEWRQYWNSESIYLLEKSPANIMLTRFLQAMFTDSYFIIVTRHPIAVSLATRRWFWPYQIGYYRIDRLIENWIVAHEHIQQDLPYLRNVIVIQYEDLVKQPNHVLTILYKFLDLKSYQHPYDIKPSMNAKYFDEWRKLQNNIISRRFLTYIQRCYAERIAQLGYSLERNQE